MESTSLIAMCCIAFVAVFALLSFLAGTMRLITATFPVRAPRTDSALIAAISTTVSTLVPGARVVTIEEE